MPPKSASDALVVRHARHDEGVGVLIGAHGSGAVAIQVEGAEADGTDLQRKAEHRSSPRGDRRAAERDPPGSSGARQIGFEHRPVLMVGVNTGSLAQRVLQLLDQRAPLVGAADRPLGQVTGHEHHPSSGQRDGVGAHHTQPGGFTGPVVDCESSQDPDQPVLRHH